MTVKNNQADEESKNFSAGRSPHRLNIPEFCDMKRFEKMLGDWAESTGLATVACDCDGRYITRNYKFTDFCEKLMRKSPEGRRRCIECDRKGHGTYLCHAGLVDFAAPITLEDGTLLGKIFGGQVLPREPDPEFYRATARQLGIEEDDYLAALRNVNVRTPEQIQASASLLASVVNMFVRTSFAARTSAASLSERASIIASLSRIYFCNYYIDLDTDTFLELDSTAEVHAFTGHRGVASQGVADACAAFVSPEYAKDFLAFTNLSTIRRRMANQQSVSFEFESLVSGWCRAVFIVVDTIGAEFTSHLIFAVQHIQEEKERELETQRILKEAAVKAERASRAKSEFLSQISHDIRTPLNGIIGMTYLTEKMDLPEKARENLRKIGTSSRFLLSLINDVLDMTRAESGKIELHPEPYPPEEFGRYIEAVIAPLCAGRSQKFLYEADPILDDVVPMLDKLRVNQIVFNLLSNAVKYTPEGGTIRYRVKETRLPGKYMAMHIEVSDNGIGMSAEFQKTLYEPFTQENRDDCSELRGSGLGLAITKKLVGLMGGTIAVDSAPGRGTTFSVNFDLACVPAGTGKVPPAPAGSPAPSVLTGKHILLCEDHPLNQEIVRALLEQKGLFVEIADNGKMGREVFENSPIGFFTCILMDLRMPVVDGFEATRQIRALNRPDAASVPIIAITASAFDEDVKRCMSVGMNGHIAKPIDPEALYGALRQHIV